MRIHRGWTRAAAALLTALTLTAPALGAGVTLDGEAVPEDQAWVAEGVSCMTLRAYADRTSCTLTWEEGTARLTGKDLILEARPGSPYITANGWPIYVAGGVQTVEGRTCLPLRVLAQATGASLSWNEETQTAALVQGEARALPAAGDREEDLYWLSRIISAESRGEPMLGLIAVGNVVLNRVASEQFPNTIREVVFDVQNGVQFEPVSNGTVYDEPAQSAIQAARLCLEGARPVEDCLYFFAPALSAGTWIVNNCTYHTTIGSHQFYS